MLDDRKIRTSPRPECYLCGYEGYPLYQNLKDRLFGAHGEWNLKQCTNRECGLVWLDPMPLEEDIGKAYHTYYTHSEHDNDAGEGWTTEVLRWNLQWIYNILKQITLIRYERKRLNLMYIKKMKPGRLLEVGCGHGRRLAKMRALGWDAVGQEIDPKAARYAGETYNLKIHLGSLRDAAFPAASFDAIIINHVIEHVHDPVALLSECYRILKLSGVLVIVTPNITSYGHRLFREHWMGLDPPRHLHIFSPKALLRVASKAGFSKHEVWTTMAKEEVFAMASMDIKDKGRHRMGASPAVDVYYNGILLQLKARVVHLFQPDSGGECVLKAIK